jgi:hypothetical protein
VGAAYSLQKQMMVALRILAFVLLVYAVLVIVAFSIFIALLSVVENEYFISTFLTLCPIDVGGCVGDSCPFSARHIPNESLCCVDLFEPGKFCISYYDMLFRIWRRVSLLGTRTGCYQSFYVTAGIMNCSREEIVMYGQTNGVRRVHVDVLEVNLYDIMYVCVCAVRCSTEEILEKALGTSKEDTLFIFKINSVCVCLFLFCYFLPLGR